ncbi:hypothetical protein TcCL_ESM11567 [Trypanosoma cruzi]|nr:hypothetical protein TcCL_ESM11567 [Trypanosoma cruzi]
MRHNVDASGRDLFSFHYSLIDWVIGLLLLFYCILSIIDDSGLSNYHASPGRMRNVCVCAYVFCGRRCSTEYGDWCSLSFISVLCSEDVLDDGAGVRAIGCIQESVRENNR